jgi:hypothetical protein
MLTSDYFQRRAHEHQGNLLKLAEMLEAGFPAETLKAFARTTKDGIRADMKLGNRSELPTDEADALRAIHSAGCHLGSVLTHDPLGHRWRADIHTAESDLALWIHRQSKVDQSRSG